MLSICSDVRVVQLLCLSGDSAGKKRSTIGYVLEIKPLILLLNFSQLA